VYCIGEATNSSAFAYVLKTKHYFVRYPTLNAWKKSNTAIVFLL
jgi:hypothetical protein